MPQDLQEISPEWERTDPGVSGCEAGSIQYALAGDGWQEAPFTSTLSCAGPRPVNHPQVPLREQAVRN